MDSVVTNFINTYYQDRKNSHCTKWDGMEKYFGESELLPLWVADMDFRVPEAVAQALAALTASPVYGYSLVPENFYQAYMAWHQRYFNLAYQQEWLRFSPGVVQTIYNVIHAFTKSGDAVVILSPVYYPFAQAVRDTQRTLVEVPLVNQAGKFGIDAEAFERAVVEHQVKVFIHCSPHNPVGRVWTEAEHQALFAICEKHHVIILADEIHQDFVYAPAQQVPAFNVAQGKYRDRLIIANSASKSFNLAALNHSSVVISNPELRQQYDAYTTSALNFAPNLFGYVATAAAYEHGHAWLEAVKQVIQYNYQYLVTEFTALDSEIVVYPLEGTYLVFVDLRPLLSKLGMSCKELIQDRCKLAVDFGEWFGEGYEGYIRINVTTDTKLLTEAINRIKTVMPA